MTDSNMFSLPTRDVHQDPYRPAELRRPLLTGRWAPRDLADRQVTAGQFAHRSWQRGRHNLRAERVHVDLPLGAAAVREVALVPAAVRAIASGEEGIEDHRHALRIKEVA